MERRPALLSSFSNCPSACGTELPLAPRSFGYGGWLRRPLGFSPPFPLCIADPLPGGGTHLSPFAFWSLRRSWFGTATGEHGPDSGNLIVYPALLSFEAFDGGGKDFSSVLMCGHLNQSG